jgi:hypothetical protein
MQRDITRDIIPATLHHVYNKAHIRRQEINPMTANMNRILPLRPAPEAGTHTGHAGAAQENASPAKSEYRVSSRQFSLVLTYTGPLLPLQWVGGAFVAHAGVRTFLTAYRMQPSGIDAFHSSYLSPLQAQDLRKFQFVWIREEAGAASREYYVRLLHGQD